MLDLDKKTIKALIIEKGIMGRSGIEYLSLKTELFDLMFFSSALNSETFYKELKIADEVILTYKEITLKKKWYNFFYLKNAKSMDVTSIIFKGKDLLKKQEKKHIK